MAAVIVFAEDDFTVGAGDCVAELVAVAAVLENGGGDAEVGYIAGGGVAAEQVGHFLSAETEEPAIGDQCYGSNWGEMRSSEGMEALILVEREQPPIGVGGEQQATMGIARPAKRAGPVAFWKLDGGAANPAGSNVEAPQSRAIIQSEYPRATNGQMAAARRFAHNRNQSRLEIYGEQMMRGYADDGLSR